MRSENMGENSITSLRSFPSVESKNSSFALLFSHVGTLPWQKGTSGQYSFVDVSPLNTLDDEVMDTEGESQHAASIRQEVQADDSSWDCTSRHSEDVYDLYKIDHSTQARMSMSRSQVVLCNGTRERASPHTPLQIESRASSDYFRRDARHTSAYPALQPMDLLDIDYPSSLEKEHVFNEYGERDGYEDDDEGSAPLIRSTLLPGR